MNATSRTGTVASASRASAPSPRPPSPSLHTNFSSACKEADTVPLGDHCPLVMPLSGVADAVVTDHTALTRPSPGSQDTPAMPDLGRYADRPPSQLAVLEIGSPIRYAFHKEAEQVKGVDSADSGGPEKTAKVTNNAAGGRAGGVAGSVKVPFLFSDAQHLSRPPSPGLSGQHRKCAPVGHVP